jgi:FkbM family methyltransferase
MTKKIVYDIGANNGDDIPYYLLKGDIVIAVEANPDLCKAMELRFSKFIGENRLFIENCVITDQDKPTDIDFFINKHSNILSQLLPPPEDKLQDFSVRRLPSRPIMDILRQYGEPYYVKIDVEHFDAQLLSCMFRNGVRPPFISAELHDIDVLFQMMCVGKYDAFKLVEGATVQSVYKNRTIICDTTNVPMDYSFPTHAAGPFGDDVDGPWMNSVLFLRLIALKGTGWKDVHATSVRAAIPDTKLILAEFMDNDYRFSELFLYCICRFFRSVKFRVMRLFRT